MARKKNNEGEFGKPFFIPLWLFVFVFWWQDLPLGAVLLALAIGIGLGKNEERRKLIGRPSWYERGYQRGVKSVAKTAETWYVYGWTDARADSGLPFDLRLGQQRAKQEVSAAGLNEDEGR